MACTLSVCQFLERCPPQAIFFKKNEKNATFSFVGSLLLDILWYLLWLFLFYFSTGEVEPVVNTPVDKHPYMLFK